MGTDLKKLRAICPKCRATVGLRPGKRMLKHGHSGFPDYDQPCDRTGEVAADANILAWALLRAKGMDVTVDHHRAERVYLEERLNAAREAEARSEAELKAAQEILAEYQAKAGGQ